MARTMTHLAAKPGQLNLTDISKWRSRSIDEFLEPKLIGEGAHGQVYMARDECTNEIVALKKIRMGEEDEGFPINALREIMLLKKLQHENVIQLKDIVTSKGLKPDDLEKGQETSSGKEARDNLLRGNFYMAFEYMDHDLQGLIYQPEIRFSLPQIKCYMKQLLTGLHYCHINQVLHRDIKGPNLLIDNKGILKLADFGLARSYSTDSQLTNILKLPESSGLARSDSTNSKLTNPVVTLWYRPPELLLGSQKYTQSVDMWSVGCILAELLYGKPIFPGKSELDQLHKILNLCGSFEESNWPGVSKLPHYAHCKTPQRLKRKLRETFEFFDRHALDLVDRMLTADPAKRISAKDALDADYFRTDPLPCNPSSLPQYETSHALQTRKKIREQMQQQQARSTNLLHNQPHLPPVEEARNLQYNQPHLPHPVPAAYPPMPHYGRPVHSGQPVQGQQYPHQQQHYGWSGHGGQEGLGPHGQGRQSHRDTNADYPANTEGQNGGLMNTQGGAMPGGPNGWAGQVGRPQRYGVPGGHNRDPQGQYYSANYQSQNGGPMQMQGGAMPGGPFWDPFGWAGQVGRRQSYGFRGGHNGGPHTQYYGGILGREPGPSQGDRGLGQW